MMSEEEQREWCWMLGRNRKDRIAVIEDLLHWSRIDGMAREDRAICKRQLARLKEEERVSHTHH